MAVQSKTAAFKSAQMNRSKGKYEQESYSVKLNSTSVKVKYFFNLCNVKMDKDTSPVCGIVNINGSI